MSSWRDYTTLDDKVLGGFGKLSKLPSLAAPKVKAFLNRPVGPRGQAYVQKSNALQQKAIGAIANTPKFNFSESRAFQNRPLLKLGAQVAEGTLNIPSRLMQNYGKTLQDINSGKIYTGTGARQFAARTGENVLDVLSLGKGKAAVQAGNQALKGAVPLAQLMKQGAKQGVKTGAKYGFGYGIAGEAQKEQTSGRNMLNAGLIGSSQGALMGGALGFALPAVKPTFRAVKNSFTNRLRPTQTESLPGRWVQQGVTRLPTMDGNIPIPNAPQGQRYIGGPFRTGFDPIQQTPTYGIHTEKYLPGQTVERGQKTPTVRDLMGQVRQALPRPGMSIQAVDNPLLQEARKYKSAEKGRFAENNADLLFHGTDKKSADAILRDGFKYGNELNKGEKTSLVSVGTRERASSIQRGKGESVQLKVPIRGLNLLGVKASEIYPNNVDKYTKLVHNGQYDGIRVIDDVYSGSGKTSEVLLRKDVATKQLTDLWKKAQGKSEPTVKDLLKEVRDAVPRPGMSIEDVSGGKYNPDAVRVGIENAKLRTPPRPTMTREEAKASGYGAQYMAEENKPAFNQSVNKWVADKELAKTKGYEVGSSVEIPKGEEWNVIKAIEGTGKTKATGAMGQIQSEFDKAYKDAKDFGIDIGYLKNYITHVWEQSPQEVAQAYRTFSQKFKGAKHRTLPTYEEGIQMGLTPRYNNPRQILAHYIQKLEETKANINFLKDLKEKGLIVDASAGRMTPGLVPLNAPGMLRSTSRIDGETAVIGNYYADPKVAEVINRIFGSTEKGTLGNALEKTAVASSTLQDLSLSGGIPKTPMNAFTIAQMTKEMLTGRLKSPIGSFFRSMSGEATDAFYKKNVGTIKKMQERNIPINTTLDIDSLGESSFFQKAFTGSKSGAWEKTKSAWNKSMNEPTFKRFMGQLQVNLFNDIEKKALKSGKTAQEAADIAGKAVSNFYGLVGTGKRAMRDQNLENLATTALFAPKYREAMVNFWVKNLKALGKPLALENRTNMKFNIGALALLAAYDYFNQSLNGTHLWENPSGKEDKLLIPGEETTLGIPYLSSIATVPRAIYREGAMALKGDISGAAGDAFQTFGSSLIKPVADVMTNKDYFGNEITKETDTTGEKFGKVGSYLAAQYAGHPYIKAGQSALSGDKPVSQILSQAMELPFRFYKTSSIASSKFWEPFKESEGYYKKYKELAKTNQEKALQYYTENKSKIDQYQSMKPIANAYARLKEDGRQGEFGNIYKAAQDGKVGAIATLYGYEELYKKANTKTLEGVLQQGEQKNKLKKLYFDQNVPSEVKTELYKAAGTDKNTVELYILSGSTIPTEQKARFVRQKLQGAKKADIMTMLDMKVITNPVVDAMYTQGLVTEEQGVILKRLIKGWSNRHRVQKPRKGRKPKQVKLSFPKPKRSSYKPVTLKQLMK